MATLIDAALILMLSCFMPFHVRMVMLNETTIEGPSPDFHVGVRRNWMQVMGRDKRYWLLPVWAGGPDGDGVHWPSPYVQWACADTEGGYGAEAGDGGASQMLTVPAAARVSCATSREEGRLLYRGDDSSDGGDI